MNIGELKELIKDMPDDSKVVCYHPHEDGYGLEIEAEPAMYKDEEDKYGVYVDIMSMDAFNSYLKREHYILKSYKPTIRIL